jgi:cation diffusion facilitator family transporter
MTGHGHHHHHHHQHGGHSHDAADSIDAALESDQRGIRAVKVSFVALTITAIAQLAIVAITGSVALLADTIHNFSDALTAVPLFIAFRLAGRPANQRYTYGYRRAEDLAGLFVVAVVAASALVAAWQAIDRLIHPRDLDHLGVLFAAGLVGLVGNELVALYRIREGRAIGSAALVADGYHARTDGFTSLAVALGAIAVWAGFERADALIGLVISVAILAVLRGVTRQIYYRLMDAVDPAIVATISHEAAHTPGVRGVSSAKVRWLGHRLVADITIDVDPAHTVGTGHQVATATHQRLTTHIAHIDDVNIHVHPSQHPSQHT